MIRGALIRGQNKNYDIDLSKLFSSIANPGVVTGMQVQATKITAGHGFIPCVRNGVTFNVLVDIDADYTFDGTGTKKVWLEVASNAISNGSTFNNIDGSNIVTVQTGASYPVDMTNKLALASIASSVITDERSFVSLKTSGISISTKFLKELADVSDTDPTEGQFMKFVSGLWTPSAFTINDLPPTNTVVEKVFYAGESLTAGDVIFEEKNQLPIDSYTAASTEASTTPASVNGGITAAKGYRMLANKNITITKITKNASSAATRAIIANNAGTILASASFVGNVATLSSPYFIASGTVFRVVADSNGSVYTATFGSPSVTRTNVNYTTGSGTISGDDNSNGWNIDSIESNTVVSSSLEVIGTTGNARKSFPVFGSGASGNTMNLCVRRNNSPVNFGIRIETDNAGVPSGTLVHANATQSIASGSFLTTVEDITITFPGSFTIPVGQRCHVVIYQGTYGSETIDASNNYSMSYTARHTTTRPGSKWNGSAWVSSHTNQTFVTSPLILQSVISKASALYSYKIPRDMTRISSAAYSVGQQVVANVLGLCALYTSLVVGSKYYLSDTAGAISLTQGTNSYYVGECISSTTLLVGKYEQYFGSLTATSSITTVPDGTKRIVAGIYAYTSLSGGLYSYSEIQLTKEKLTATYTGSWGSTQGTATFSRDGKNTITFGGTSTSQGGTFYFYG